MLIRFAVGSVLCGLLVGPSALADSPISPATSAGVSHFAQLRSDFFDSRITGIPDLATALGQHRGNCFFGHATFMGTPPDQNASVQCTLTIMQASNGPLFPARNMFYITCPNSAGVNSYELSEAALTSDAKALYSVYHFIDADWQCGDPDHYNPALDGCSGHTSFKTAQFFLRRYIEKDYYVADFLTSLNGSYYPQYDPNAYCYFDK